MQLDTRKPIFRYLPFRQPKLFTSSNRLLRRYESANKQGSNISISTVTRDVAIIATEDAEALHTTQISTFHLDEFAHDLPLTNLGIFRLETTYRSLQVPSELEENQTGQYKDFYCTERPAY